jgi:phenolic acid decarboxylase
MRYYFADSMIYAAPEPRHKLCLKFDMVTLQQRGRDNFAVRYGKEIHADLTYSEACGKLGQALMHQAACNDLLDNRLKGER